MGRGRSIRILLLALCVVAGATAAFPLVSSAAPASSKAPAQPTRAQAKVRPSEVTLPSGVGGGVPVTMPPVGLSVEYPTMAQALAGGSCPPPALAAELLRLGSPPLELAGLSQDLTAPDGAISGLPTSWETATLYSLPANFWSQLQCLLGTARDPLTVGLNMRTGNLAWATQMAAKAQSAAGTGLGFSLGNEPDLFDLPNLSSLAKPQVGEEAVAANLYLRLAAYLRPAIGNAPLVAPELSQPARWHSVLPGVLEQLHAQTVAVHLYPLTACRSLREVTIGGLLSSRAADSPARLSWVVADAQAAGLPAIISEANSASCGGRSGVSDAPAAAIWAVRFVLSALKTGFREVRFHFAGDPYDAFLVRGAGVYPRPLESALVALNQWLPVGSSLRTVPGVRELAATAFTRPAGTTTLLLDNAGSKARPVVVRNARRVQLAILSPLRGGLVTQTRRAAGRLKFLIAPNTLVAISAAP
ncbi:MAG TPA: hypothetical protein VHY83_15635 [Solirubrobacteraceae bacterium]|jgi:hypothetical protein|nr:hypothetical protein [Solirubrobacteraceae bacterium]